jgi:hypothetical protein
VELESENFAQSCGIGKNIMSGLWCSRTGLNSSRFTSAPVKSQHHGNKKCAKCPDVAASPHQAKLIRICEDKTVGDLFHPERKSIQKLKAPARAAGAFDALGKRSLDDAIIASKA